MLQQTQVDTVIPYFNRWMRTFPTVQKLAKAPLDQVLKLWEGLGYYSRARNIHKAANKITQNFRGKIPENYEELLKLPGIGRYTAGAILSIAFDWSVPILDGNVMRFISRLYAINQNISDLKVQKKFWRKAEKLVPPKTRG